MGMLQVRGGLDLLEKTLPAPKIAASSGRRTLRRRVRLLRRSCGRYTVAMPPWPSSRSRR